MAEESRADQLAEAIMVLKHAIYFLLEDVEMRYRDTPDQPQKAVTASRLRDQLDRVIGWDD